MPEDIKTAFQEFMGGFVNRLGLQNLADAMCPIPGEMNQLCIENPFREFNGFQMPAMRACLDFDELAKQAWVQPLRMMLLFCCFWLFISSVVTVLRSG